MRECSSSGLRYVRSILKVTAQSQRDSTGQNLIRSEILIMFVDPRLSQGGSRKSVVVYVFYFLFFSPAFDISMNAVAVKQDCRIFKGF